VPLYPAGSLGSGAFLTLGEFMDAQHQELPAGGVGVGSSVRPILDKLVEIVSVRDYEAQGDGVTDDSAAFQAAVNSGVACVYVPAPNAGQHYRITTALTIPAGVRLVGMGGRPTIKAVGDFIAVTAGGDGAGIESLRIDADKGSKTGSRVAVNLGVHAGCVVRDCEIANAKGYGVHMLGAGNEVAGCYVRGGDSYGIVADGASAIGNRLNFNQLDNVSTGILVFAGSNRNEIAFNWCETNGRELVNIGYDSWGNRVVGNRPRNTGDSGLTIAGYLNTVTANTIEDALYWGIYVSGERNTITGNVAINPGRYNVDAGSPITVLAGIGIIPELGGRAHQNTVTGNKLEERRTRSVCNYGIVVGTHRYVDYAAAQTITAGDFRLVGGARVYRALTGGTTVDVTGPTHTSGDVTLDGISWRFATGLIKHHDQPWIQWAQGQAVLIGEWRFHLQNIYRCSVAGTTGATAPTHVTGAVSDGGATWQWVETRPTTVNASDNQVSGNQFYGFLNDSIFFQSTNVNTGVEDNRLRLRIPRKQNVCDVIIGNVAPLANISATIGSVYLRVDQTGVKSLRHVYVKYSGATPTTADWWPLMPAASGTTALRPASLASQDTGLQYFDTTLVRTIVWSGTAWINVDGTAL
jgi:hypothetical protein